MNEKHYIEDAMTQRQQWEQEHEAVLASRRSLWHLIPSRVGLWTALPKGLRGVMGCFEDRWLD